MFQRRKYGSISDSQYIGCGSEFPIIGYGSGFPIHRLWQRLRSLINDGKGVRQRLLQEPRAHHMNVQGAPPSFLRCD
jgi:proline racemase